MEEIKYVIEGRNKRIMIFPNMKMIEQEGILKGWSRKQMYNRYCKEMAVLYPSSFNIDGSQKTLWQLIKGFLNIIRYENRTR